MADATTVIGELVKEAQAEIDDLVKQNGEKMGIQQSAAMKMQELQNEDVYIGDNLAGERAAAKALLDKGAVSRKDHDDDVRAAEAKAQAAREVLQGKIAAAQGESNAAIAEMNNVIRPHLRQAMAKLSRLQARLPKAPAPLPPSPTVIPAPIPAEPVPAATAPA